MGFSVHLRALLAILLLTVFAAMPLAAQEEAPDFTMTVLTYDERAGITLSAGFPSGWMVYAEANNIGIANRSALLDEFTAQPDGALLLEASDVMLGVTYFGPVEEIENLAMIFETIIPEEFTEGEPEAITIGGYEALRAPYIFREVEGSLLVLQLDDHILGIVPLVGEEVDPAPLIEALVETLALEIEE